jgi:hypothetical protein
MPVHLAGTIANIYLLLLDISSNGIWGGDERESSAGR